MKAADLLRLHSATVVAVGIAVTHFSVALAVSERPASAYFTLTFFAELAAFLGLPVLFWVIFTGITALRNGADSPLKFLADRIVAERVRLLDTAALLLCYALVNRSYRALKVAIPRLNDYYADPIFIAWDVTLFGTDPWRLTHAWLGDQATLVVDWLYFVWVTVVLVAYALAAFTKDRRTRFQACVTYLLVWILLGNVMAIWLSSAGPTYYDDFFASDRFAPLMQILQEQDLIANHVQEYLLVVTGDEAIGTGISAMPSVHCALTMFLVIFAWRVGGPKWALAALAYHLVILVGSVHLGWHYAVDGLISMLVVPLIWIGVGLLYDRLPHPYEARHR